MTDMQRYSDLFEQVQPSCAGEYVLAADAEAHEKAAVEAALAAWESSQIARIIEKHEAVAREQAIRDAISVFREMYDTLNYEHAFKPETCKCVWCEDGDIILQRLCALLPEGGKRCPE